MSYKCELCPMVATHYYEAVKRVHGHTDSKSGYTCSYHMPDVTEKWRKEGFSVSTCHPDDAPIDRKPGEPFRATHIRHHPN